MTSSSPLPTHVVSFLRQESPLRVLQQSAFDTLLPRLGYRQYRHGDLLFHEEDAADVVWLLVAGWVRLYRFTRDAEEKVLSYRTRGQLVGDSGVLGDCRHECLAEAYTDVNAVLLSNSDFTALMSDQPAWTREVLKLVTIDRARLTRDLVDLSIMDARRRLVRTLITLAERHGVREEATMKLAVPMTQLELASIIGASRETLSRLCAHLPQIRIEQKELSISNWTEFAALND